MQNKLLYSEFFKYLNTYDIVVLLETHVGEDKIVNFEKYFGNFNTYWKPATRSRNFGRHSGGCVYGVKKDLIKETISHVFERWGDIDIIKIRTKNLLLTVIPLYLKSSNWENEFTELKSLFLAKNLLNPILIGDMNVRIGEWQQIMDTDAWNLFKAGCSLRKSKDKVLNGRGKQLMEFCTDYGMIVLNGVTQGDEDGHFTFANNVGQSVNDICAVSYDLLQSVNSFEVDERTWSDHFPILLTLETETINGEVNVCSLLPKLKWVEGKKLEYQKALDINIEDQKSRSSVVSLGSISNAIVKVTEKWRNQFKFSGFKEKWFNSKCRKARDESFKMLKLYRKKDNEKERKDYLEANKKFKQICEESKKEYYKELEYKIGRIQNSKEWWNIAKEIRKDIGNHCPNITAVTFQTYFENLLNHPSFSPDICYAGALKLDPDLDAPITLIELQEALTKSKCNKAPGIDRIPYEFYKHAPDTALVEITKIYNVILETGQADESFRTSVIYPIFKKGDNTNPSNFRGISFMNCIAKILMGIINTRLSNWTEKHKIINEYQAGFRKNYSTIDNIYSLSTIVHLKLNERKKVYAYFVDFKAAFDKVSRNLLMYKLSELGISTKLLKLLQSIYQTTKSVVWTGKEMSSEFATLSGVKQGCLLSPLLFALYINDIHDAIGGGLHVGNKNIRTLMYADDIVILSDNINTLQDMINKLYKYCMNWNLEINMAKSEIMVFKKGGRTASAEKWMLNGTEIRITTQYCYLGMILTPRLNFKKHIENRNNSAKNSLNVTWNNFLSKKNISLRAKWQLFLAVCRAIQTYGAQIWGYSHFEEVDKLQRYFVKKLLNLPAFTPTYALMLETNLDNGYIFTLDLHLRYITRTLFEYNSDRLPHFLSKIILEKKILWAKSVVELGVKNGVEFNFQSMSRSDWTFKHSTLLENIKCNNNIEYTNKALNSDRFYKYLNFNKGQEYIRDEFTQNQIMWIMKARCNLIQLNGTRFQNQGSKLCSLCNLREDESILHFIGQCPALKEFRRINYGHNYLTNDQAVSILNGEYCSFTTTVQYIKCAMKYRKFLIEEFNF